MSQAQAVAETDRLPWLADEPLPERRKSDPAWPFWPLPLH